MTSTTDPITRRLESCYTGVLHDVMRDAGMQDFVLPGEIRPILPAQQLCGPAFTISGQPAPGADPHETLLAWTGLLSQAPTGSLWVCQPNDRRIAHMGELSAETLQFRGVRGALIDGFSRDIGFLLDLGFQTWCRGFTPRDIVGAWLPDATDVPIVIGEVTINPGDYLCGDRDGCVVIPHEKAADIVTQAEAAIAKEDLVRTAILQGIDPQEAYKRHGKF